MSSVTLPGAAPSAPAADGRSALRRDLTYVELVHQPDRAQRWIRFGVAHDEVIVDRRIRFLGFRPNAVLAFVRWAANDFGTVVSRIDILRAVGRGESHSTVPGVIPGGDSLLRLSGWDRVERVLQAIDAIEALGLNPAEAAPDHWRHLHHRLSAGEPVCAYTLERHRAWRARRELLS